jgi:hypothetical protein
MGAFDNLQSNLSGGDGGGGAGGYTNQVYLGPADSRTIRMKKTGQAVTVPAGDKTLTTQEAKAKYLTDETLRNNWNVTLRKNGITTDPIKARALWDMAVAGASDWYATSDGTQKVTPEQYLTWYVGGQKKEAPIPSRSIYEYAPEQLAAKIDDVAKSLLGRAITDADKSAEWYQDLNSTLNKMAMQGTVTEPTKKVKNPKTGKMETVSIQRPEVTSEGITQTITSALKEADPVSLERKQNLDFANWAFQKMGGRG